MTDHYGNASQPQDPNIPPPPPAGQASGYQQPGQPGGYQQPGTPGPAQAAGGYQPPAGGYGAGGPGRPGWDTGDGQPAGGNFFSNLFDLSFSRYITPSVVKILFVLLLVVLGLTYLFWIVTGFAQSVGLGLLVLVLGALLLFVYIIVVRVSLEVLVAVIQVAKNTGQLLERR